MTDGLQVREPSLTGYERPNKIGDEKICSEKQVQDKADTASTALIDGDNLPEDLLARVFRHLPTTDLLGCAAVCRHWQQIVHELTGNAFTYNLDLECPFCHAEVSGIPYLSPFKHNRKAMSKMQHLYRVYATLGKEENLLKIH